MTCLCKSHSTSPIHRNCRPGIATSSVSQYPSSLSSRRLPPLRELKLHSKLQELYDSSEVLGKPHTTVRSDNEISSDYIDNLNSSGKKESNSIKVNANEAQEEESSSIKTSHIISDGLDELQKRPQTNISITNNNNPTSAMSSRRSGHGSSSKGSSRRQHIYHHNVSQLIESLNTRRINTLTELRRIERIAAASSAEDQLAFQGPMTSAWNAYVMSNNMLNELRGLTRNYPFSSEALDDAKWRVSNDPESNRSWNYAWLILVKLRDNQMISTYAASEAAKPEMWGGEYPDQQDADQLAACFAFEWNEALEQMLRHWETPPTTTGY